MGTRTAPDFATAAQRRQVTFHLIDASGDLWPQPIDVAVAAAAGDIEGLADSYQAASQASLYGITDTQFREGDADPDNAEVGQRNSVKDGINILLKNPATNDTRSMRVVAPEAATMQGNQDIPLASSTELAAVILDWLTLSSGYNAVSAQYTERRERKGNAKIKL